MAVCADIVLGCILHEDLFVMAAHGLQHVCGCPILQEQLLYGYHEGMRGSNCNRADAQAS